jgi:uncharacterized peroxidase-related enzyme
MSYLPKREFEDIPGEARALLGEWEEAYSRPSHIYRVMAQNPRVMAASAHAWLELVTRPSLLDRWIKEAVVVITCSTQGTPYCVQGHSHAVTLQGISEDQVAAIREHRFDGFEEPARSIFRFARKAAGEPKQMTDADYDMLRQAGLDDERILEVLGCIWANTAMNLIVDALGVKRSAEQMKELQGT